MKELFHRAVERDPATRGTYLDEACAGDPDLRHEVDSLIAAHGHLGSFIEEPAGTPGALPGSPPSDPALSAGSRLGPYELIDLIGTGGMGDVYRARDPRLDRQVALKVVSSNLARDPERRERFLREARMVSSLNHPHICTIHEIGSDGGLDYICFEYIEGKTLAALLEGSLLSFEQLLDLAIPLADALVYAHHKGIVHRDLKPGNIMVSELGPKILDFGLAKALAVAGEAGHDADTSLTGAGLVMGTLAYMSPEQAMGRRVDERSDIFSLGAVLYEMASGKPAFAGRVPVEVMDALLHESPVPLCRLRPDLPPGLSLVVERALQKDATERYAHMADLAADLRGVSGPALPAPLAAATLRRVRTSLRAGARRYWTVAAALVLGGSVVGIVATPRPPPATSSRAVVAVLPLLNATGDPARDDLGAGVADVLISTLAQVPGVTMVSREATLAYRSRQQPVESVAQALGADLVVDGVVRKSGDTARVTLSLLRPGSQLIAWTRTYEAAFGDMFTLQNEAAIALSEALRVTLTPEQRRRIERPPTTNAEALADYAQGRAFLERKDVPGNIEHAVSLLESATRKDPRFARAHAALGQAYWARFRDSHDEKWADKAQMETTESLRLDPEDAGARHALAVVLDGRGRKAEAVEELKKAIALQAGNDEAHSLLGQILCDQGRRDEGVAELRWAITLRPNYWAHHYALGVAQFHAGRFPEAAAAFRRVAELQPDSARGLLMLGTTQHAGGETAAAIETYRRALAVAPEPSVYTNLGVALTAIGRLSEAAHAFEEAARLSPRSPIKQRNLGDIYQRLGNAARARKSYERAAALCEDELRTNPSDARVLSYLAVYEAKVGRHQSAARHAGEALALGTQIAEVVYQAAVVHSLAGRFDESLAALQKAVALGYSRQLASEDEDLSRLRPRSAFQALIAQPTGAGVKGGGT